MRWDSDKPAEAPRWWTESWWVRLAPRDGWSGELHGSAADPFVAQWLHALARRNARREASLARRDEARRLLDEDR
jgi:hypothetical protein